MKFKVMNVDNTKANRMNVLFNAQIVIKRGIIDQIHTD